VVEMWKEGSKIIFNTKTKERGTTALIGFCDPKEDAKM